MKQLFLFLKIFLFYVIFLHPVNSETINKIKIVGNDRISYETIKMFANIEINENVSTNKLNLILKDLYKTNYFKNVSVSLNNSELNILVEEFPIIQKITYQGIKSKKILQSINAEKLIKEKSPYNDLILKNEKNRITSKIKELGYYNAIIETSVETVSKNLVNINFNFNLGEKAKIKKISFIGNKIFKDRKLKRIIASTEFKYWKFISGRKYLNPAIADLDKRLLKNFYLNNGYYNVKINSSFAKLINDNEFELIFNIDANEKVFFGDLKLDIPMDFESTNFTSIAELFQKIENKPYSINLINKILDEIDEITVLDQYQFINIIQKINKFKSNNMGYGRRYIIFMVPFKKNKNG